MRTLSDLFVVYSPIINKEVKKEITLPEPDFDLYDYMDRIKSIPKKEITEQEEVFESLYDELWESKPKTWIWNSDNIIIKHDDSGTHLRYVTPFDNKIVKEAMNSEHYKPFKYLWESYKSKHKNNGLTSKDWDTLEAIAGIESTFENTQNKGGSNAYGYFQFMPATANGIKPNAYEDMKNNPNLQFDLAVKHYKYLQRRLKNSAEYLQNSRLTPLQVMYGMWWNPGSVENYLRTNQDKVSDSDGNDIISIFKKAEIWKG